MIKQIKAMTANKEGFVCLPCRISLQFVSLEIDGVVSCYIRRKRLGELIDLSLSMITQSLVVKLKKAEAEMQAGCLCKGQ